MSELFLPQELIRKKRDGISLSDPEIGYMVQGITDGSLTDAQLGAFAMAVFKCGMSMDERVNLTRHMMNSGDTLNWDKHNLNGPPTALLNRQHLPSWSIKAKVPQTSNL